MWVQHPVKPRVPRPHPLLSPALCVCSVLHEVVGDSQAPVWVLHPRSTPGSWGEWVQAPHPACTQPVVAGHPGSFWICPTAGGWWGPRWGCRGASVPPGAVAYPGEHLGGGGVPPPCLHVEHPCKWVAAGAGTLCPLVPPAVTRKSPSFSPLPRNTPTRESMRGGGFAPTSGCRVLGAPRTRMLLPWQRVCWAPSPPGTPRLAQARSCLHVLRPQAAWHTAAALAGWLGSLGHRQAAARASPTPRTGWHICARWGGCGAGGRRRRGALRQRGGRQGQHPSPCRARAAAGHGCCSVGTVQAGPRCQRASGCQQG